MLARASSTFDAICEAQADGRGVIPWCRERDVRYLDVMRWIESDAARSFAFDVATKARGTATVAQLESVSRQALNGAVDPRAAAVASKNLQWLAAVYDRKRYGEQMRVDHRHGFSADHLAALKALANRDGASGESADARVVPGDLRSGGNGEGLRVTRESASGFQHAASAAPAAASVAREGAPPIDVEFRQVAQSVAPQRHSAQVLDEAERLGI